MKPLLQSCFVILIVAAPLTFAAGDITDVKVALHLQPHTTKGMFCSRAQTEYACDAVSFSSNVVHHADNLTIGYDMYIVVLDIPTQTGIMGVKFGIDYTGLPGGMGVFEDVLCADLMFPSASWPNPGGDVTFIWDACQNTPDPTDPELQGAAVAYAMYVYAYGDDEVCITRNSIDRFEVGDCADTWHDLSMFFGANAGCAGFGTPEGWDPCFGVYSPLEETTWGDIKKRF